MKSSKAMAKLNDRAMDYVSLPIVFYSIIPMIANCIIAN